MVCSQFYVLVVFLAALHGGRCQEYDFAAEMTRQCLVPDPVGLVDCVEAKVTLPYLTSWVECTNSLGENVKTSADVVNYRCKSVWEGKGLIPEVFFLKDCVIEKTGLPAKNVSAEVLGAYKECESSPSSPQQQRTKTAPVQQQQMRVSSVVYNGPAQNTQAPQQFQIPAQQVRAPAPPTQPQNMMSRQQYQPPVARPVQIQQPVLVPRPVRQQMQAPAFIPPQPLSQVRMPGQQVQAPMPRQQYQPPVMRPVQMQQGAIAQRPVQQQFQAPMPRQQYQAPAMRPIQMQQAAIAQSPVQQQYQAPMPRQQYQAPVMRPVQIQQSPVVQRPTQQQFQAPVSRPAQQAPNTAAQPYQQQVPVTFNPQSPPATSRSNFQTSAARPQYPGTMSASVNTAPQRQPFSQQFFMIHPQPPLPNQQSTNNPILSQKTVPSPSLVAQQQISASAQQFTAVNPSGPYTYSFQINHPIRPPM